MHIFVLYVIISAYSGYVFFKIHSAIVVIVVAVVALFAFAPFCVSVFLVFVMFLWLLFACPIWACIFPWQTVHCLLPLGFRLKNHDPDDATRSISTWFGLRMNQHLPVLSITSHQRLVVFLSKMCNGFTNSLAQPTPCGASRPPQPRPRWGHFDPRLWLSGPTHWHHCFVDPSRSGTACSLVNGLLQLGMVVNFWMKLEVNHILDVNDVWF